jgi:hypothetical protein
MKMYSDRYSYGFIEIATRNERLVGELLIELEDIVIDEHSKLFDFAQKASRIVFPDCYIQEFVRMTSFYYNETLVYGAGRLIEKAKAFLHIQTICMETVTSYYREPMNLPEKVEELKRTLEKCIGFTEYLEDYVKRTQPVLDEVFEKAHRIHYGS